MKWNNYLVKDDAPSRGHAGMRDTDGLSKGEEG